VLKTSRANARRVTRTTAAVALTALVAALVPVALSTGVAAAPAAPSDDLWSPTAERVQASNDGNRRRVNPSSYAAYTLDAGALDAILDSAPDEAAKSAEPATLQVPTPNGNLVAFEIVESPVLDEQAALRHPDIKTYVGRLESGTHAVSIRLDVTPQGFHASVRGSGPAWYIDPAYNGDDSLYVSYFGSSLPADEKALVEPELSQETVEAVESIGEGPGNPARQREYRLALSSDPAYSEYFAPGADETTSNTVVAAEKTTLINRVNHVYGDDLGVRMTLIGNNDLLNFNTPAEAWGANGPCGLDPCYLQSQIDPVTGTGCTSGLLTRNRFVIGQIIGAGNYDVGHIGLGIDGGGVASLASVGRDTKAQGCTGLDTPDGDFFAIDYVAHELGHQFNGPHTFNGVNVNCAGGNRSASSSVEPGSGSSVMAYAGICGEDNLQPHSDPYFSQRSQASISDHINGVYANVNEVQSAGFTGFDGTDSFTLTFPGWGTTSPITRGTTYNAVGIAAAVTAIMPAGGVVAVSPHFSATPGNPTDAGFTLTFTGTLAGTDVPNPTLTPTGFTAIVNDIAKGGPPTNGGITVATPGNRNPVVTAPADKFIPMRTPFALTGSATDPDGDALVYIWEQADRGGNSGTALTNNAKTNGPLFRIFSDYADVTPAETLEYESPGENLATGSPTRVFPDMAQVLAGQTNAETGTCPAPQPTDYVNGVSGTLKDGPVLDCFSEFLPTADYIGDSQAPNSEPSLNFRLTARDLEGPNGGTELDDTKLRIDKTAGPFLATSQATATSYAGGSTQTVTWAVNGTDKATLAPNVKISLSTDGGQTFSQVLAASTPNDGSEAITVPNVGTTTGRIKIEAVDNYFFDVNDAPITVTQTVDSTDPETTITSGPADGSLVLASSAAFGFSSSESGSTFECKLDGVATSCSASPVTLTGLSRKTHTFTVAAVDQAGNRDETPATRTFTVPLDDRDLDVVFGAWKEKSAAAAYAGTFLKVKQKNASLGYPVIGAKSLSLIVGTRPNFGRVKVYLDGDLLKSVSLKGPSGFAKVVPLGTFATPENGILTIQTKNKKQVRIDGLAVVTAP
jgi:hypothetical protein